MVNIIDNLLPNYGNRRDGFEIRSQGALGLRLVYNRCVHIGMNVLPFNVVIRRQDVRIAATWRGAMNRIILSCEDASRHMSICSNVVVVRIGKATVNLTQRHGYFTTEVIDMGLQ